MNNCDNYKFYINITEYYCSMSKICNGSNFKYDYLLLNDQTNEITKQCYDKFSDTNDIRVKLNGE